MLKVRLTKFKLSNKKIHPYTARHIIFFKFETIIVDPIPDPDPARQK
jgi:hypothetical protein